MTLDEALAFAATFPEAEDTLRWGNRSWAVRELITDAWLAKAPVRLARSYQS